MINQQDIISDIQYTRNKIGSIPTRNEYNKYGKYSEGTARFIFGSWSKAVFVATREDISRKYKDKVIGRCKNCGLEVVNSVFCSKSCSAKFNNKSENGRKTGKKLSKSYCKECGEEIAKTSSDNRKLCRNCSENIVDSRGQRVHISKATKKMMLTNNTQKYSRIRAYARRAAIQFGILDECHICGYDLHVECSHKKSIQSFPDNVLLTEINDPSNLVGLCRNHHWEFDNGYLEI